MVLAPDVVTYLGYFSLWSHASVSNMLHKAYRYKIVHVVYTKTQGSLCRCPACFPAVWKEWCSDHTDMQDSGEWPSSSTGWIKTLSLRLSFLLSEFSSLFLMASKMQHEITSNSTQSVFLAYQNHKHIRRILTNISFLSYSLNNLFVYMKLLSA